MYFLEYLKNACFMLNYVSGHVCCGGVCCLVVV